MNNYYDVENIAGKTILYLDSDRISECIKYFIDRRIDILGVNPIRGYKSNNLEFLRSYPQIKKIEVVFPSNKNFDISPIQDHISLVYLTVSASVPLDLSIFPNLEELHTYWHPNLIISGCKKLRVLDLSGFKSSGADLTDFPDIPSLSELILVQSNLTSLLGVSRLRYMKRLELAYLTKLESLRDIDELNFLECLECQKCRKLKDHHLISSIKSLKVLRFNDCGSINDLSFIVNLPQLEEFRFVNTNIVDGNLEPILRLKRVGFFHKRHFSHTPKEVDDIISKRQ